MVVLIGGEKGGTGKSSLATNLAASRADAGHDLILVDTDKQGSASHWVATREEQDASLAPVPCVQVFKKRVTAQVQELSDRYDDIVIDAGGRDSVELRAALVVADRLFVPLQPSQFDMWTIERMNDLIEQAQAINPDLQGWAVINRASPNPVVTESEEAQEVLEEFDNIAYSGIVIHERIAFRRAVRSGRSVFEMGDPDPKACRELSALYEAIYDQSLTRHE